ncbi:hypothetical protein GCM10010182_67450 [Actinomadura cremea]|nr:hypothetical protein GCM10010182_67450 [Actinomadura cremea]
MTDICVQPHEQEHTALPALRLCTGCYYGLRGHIKALPRLHADLGGALATGGTPGTGARVSGSSSEPLPINTAVADLRDQIRHDLVWWTIFVADERGFKVPANRVPVIGQWLIRQVDWIAASLPAAEECPPVMKALAGRARAILHPDGARRIRIGPCREMLEEGPCSGTLYATCRAEDDPRPSRIYCGTCEVEYGPESWRRFGREYLRGQQQEGRMVG